VPPTSRRAGPGTGPRAIDPTAAAIAAVGRRLAQGGVRHVVIATSTGETGVRFLQALAEADVQVVCVTHHAGFRTGDELDLLPEHASRLREASVPVLVATHALSGVGRSISTQFGGATPVEVVAHTLRLFGQGMKVCVEIAVMAADAGLIPTDLDVMCVGGTGRGADTVVVLRPAHMNRFFDLRIREVLCTPRDI
jgi:uncharacterized protein